MSMFQINRTEDATVIRRNLKKQGKVISATLRREALEPEHGLTFYRMLVEKLNVEGFKDEARVFVRFMIRLKMNPNAKLRFNW